MERNRRKRRESIRRIGRRKREERNEELMRMARKAKTQKELWEVINKERWRGVGVDNEIMKDEWNEYFKEILGSGRRIKEDLRQKREREEEVNGGQRLEWEEVEDVIIG